MTATLKVVHARTSPSKIITTIGAWNVTEPTAEVTRRYLEATTSGRSTIDLHRMPEASPAGIVLITVAVAHIVGWMPAEKS